MKKYLAEKGVPLDANFLQHVANGCEQCKRFDAEKPDTLTLLCLEGSVLWKAENHKPVKRQQRSRPDTWASKDEVKARMKYKE